MAATARRPPDRRAQETVLAVLPRSVKAHASGTESDADLIVNGQPLQIKWVGEGGLSHVRRLLGESRRPDIVVARRFLPAAREALSAAGVGWVDETGAAEIDSGAIVVSRTGRHPGLAERPKRWTQAVLAVAEALLCGTKATVSETRAATGLSTGSSTYALRVLTDLGLLTAETQRGRRSARSMVDSTDLLDAYASAADALAPQLRLEVGVTWRDHLEGLATVGNTWDRVNLAWAATGVAAAAMIAPYLTNVGVTEVYVDADTIVGLEAVAAEAGLRPIEGGRLILRPFPTVSVQRLADEIYGIRVSPWPRVYVDLRTSGVRGEEAAEHLREAVGD